MSKKMIAGAVAAAMLTLGVGGAALAAQQGTTQVPGGQKQAQHAEQQEASVKGTVPAPAEKGEQNDAAEAQQLQGLAKVDRAQAERAALAAVPGGKVQKAELGNEDGYVVYDVEVVGQNGQATDVKVDAGNGKVLAKEAAGPEHGKAHEGPEQNDAQEGGATGR